MPDAKLPFSLDWVGCAFDPHPQDEPFEFLHEPLKKLPITAAIATTPTIPAQQIGSILFSPFLELPSHSITYTCTH